MNLLGYDQAVAVQYFRKVETRQSQLLVLGAKWNATVVNVYWAGHMCDVIHYNYVIPYHAGH